MYLHQEISTVSFLLNTDASLNVKERHFIASQFMSDTHFQHTFSKNGSPGQVSIAQYGIGKRIQFKPAPAISARSCSVCE